MSKPTFGDYEKVRFDDFVKGVIEEVQESLIINGEGHEFPKWKKDATGKNVKIGVNKKDGVRFKYKLEGCEKPHYSRWMNFMYSELSNLYNKYLSNLVEGATPNMDFDIQQLTGMEVKTLWDNKDFQGIITIMPLKAKIVPKIEAQDAPQAPDNDPEDDHGIVESEQEDVGF